MATELPEISGTEMDDQHHKCWGCDNFLSDGNSNQFYCLHSHMLILADEPISDNPECGDLCNNDYRRIAGTTTILYRLLCIHNKLLVSALPPNLVGCIGNLIHYGLARYDRESEMKAYFKGKSRTVKSRVLCLEE